MNWSIEPITLDLRYTWKISRNASDLKTNLIVKFDDGKFSGRGEAAPNVRYHESAEEGLKVFEKISPELELVQDLASLRNLLKDQNVFKALSFAIESAWIHRQSAREGRTVSNLLGIPDSGEVGISYTIPIMDTGLIKTFYSENRLDRFPFIKLKVNHEDAYESLRYLLTFCNKPVMVDANESFIDVEQCIYWMEKIRRLPLVFIEQPMPATSNRADMAWLKERPPMPIFGDESYHHAGDVDLAAECFHGVNVKLVKTGGISGAYEALRAARQRGLQTMIGCMIESSVLITAAAHLAELADHLDIDGNILINNDPYLGATTEKGIMSFANTPEKFGLRVRPR